jgi:hypothetical protein
MGQVISGAYPSPPVPTKGKDKPVEVEVIDE